MPVWGRVFDKALDGTGREHRDSLQTELLLAEYVRTLEPGAAHSSVEGGVRGLGPDPRSAVRWLLEGDWSRSTSVHVAERRAARLAHG